MSLELMKKIRATNTLISLKNKKILSAQELKLIIKVFSYYTPYMRQVKSKDNIDINDIDISNIPKKIQIDKETLIDILGISKSHIKEKLYKLSDQLQLINAEIQSFHNGKLEIIKMNWFPTVRYIPDDFFMEISVNEDLIKNFMIFLKYSDINPEYISAIKSDYGLNLYLMFKIMKDGSYQNNMIIGTDEFRKQFGLENKYTATSMFKKKVLAHSVKEISDNTDLNVTYSIYKENSRSLNKIKFTFNYDNSESLDQIDRSKSIGNIDSNKNSLLFEEVLINWGIRAKKVVEIEDKYSLDVIQSAIDLTLEKEKAGEIKTTKAAIFLGILENKQLTSDEQFERAKKEIEQQQEKKLREKISAEYDKHSSFILSNQDIIQSALTSNTKHLPITDKDATPIFNKLKKIDADKFRAYTVPLLSFYHFETNSNVSSTLSDILDRSQYIEIEEYKDDIAIVQAYKKAIDKIKEDKYITPQQQEILKKEAQEIINLLLGF